MNGKWPFFAMGIMVGVIAALSVALAMNAGHATAAAAPRSGTDNTGAGLIAVSGGTEANRDDMIWIIYKRATTAEDSGGTGIKLPPERITLALYKPPAGRPAEPVIKLQSVREITWDLMLMQFPGDKITPTLQDVIKTVQDQKKD